MFLRLIKILRCEGRETSIIAVSLNGLNRIKNYWEVSNIMKMSNYVRNAKLRLKKIDDDHFLRNEDDDSIFLLNQTAFNIWELCDGSRSLNSIIDELSKKYGIQASQMSGNVHKIIDEFMDLGLIYNNDGKKPN